MRTQRILTILGTRPEIIRLSRIIPKLDLCTDHHVLHTGQNYDRTLNDVFFQELATRQPNHVIDSQSSTFAGQLSKILVETEAYINEFKPDKILILGDTNSGLTAIIAERLGIPVYHMEAGNRCFDREVPEELNRRLIDGISSFNLPYTYGSRDNLTREGHDFKRITVTGNPIGEVIAHYKPQIDQSAILDTLGLEKSEYVLVTAHRAENVDNQERLEALFLALQKISKDYPVVFSCHPRTRSKLEKFNIDTAHIRVLEPWGFFDFVQLEQHARLVVTDSGTVCEEACILGVPCVTSRNSTERPETIACKSNIVAGVTKEGIVEAYQTMLYRKAWHVPAEYQWPDVSDRVIEKLLG